MSSGLRSQSPILGDLDQQVYQASIVSSWGVYYVFELEQSNRGYFLMHINSLELI